MIYAVFTLLLLAALAMLLAPVFKADTIPEKQRRNFILAVVAIFFIGAFALYAVLGSPGIVPLLAARNTELAALKETIVRRSAEIKANPKNLAAWVELGQCFMETGQFSAAANALKQSVVLSHGNPLFIMAYAQALIFAADGKITDDAQKSLHMVLLQQPENPEARYYLAVRQLQDGHTQEAMKEMKELYRSLPEGSPVKEMIDRERGKNNP